MSDDGRDKRDPELKCFVGGLSWQMNEADLKDAFSKYDPTAATIILDKNTNRPRGFGFIWFKDKLGMDDAIRDMHNKELEGRAISVTRAVPMDQTRPGTPAAALSSGRRDMGGRYPPRDSGRDYGRGYDRGPDRYDPRSYDRGGYGGYGADPRYAGYERGYDSRYGAAPYARDPYAGRDPYGGYGGGYPGYERSYEGGYADRYQSSHDDRGAGGPDRRSYAPSRSGPYERAPERRPDGRR